jgi:hypothetical protein
MRTGWGRVPVVGSGDLIELKKTRRFVDYDVISNLVRLEVASAEASDRALLRRAARATYRAEDRAEFLRLAGNPRPIARIRNEIAAEVAALQRADMAYWSRRIADLRKLRRAGRLLREGTTVRALLRESYVPSTR